MPLDRWTVRPVIMEEIQNFMKDNNQLNELVEQTVNKKLEEYEQTILNLNENIRILNQQINLLKEAMEESIRT